MVSSGEPMRRRTSSVVMPGWTCMNMSSLRAGAAFSIRPLAHPARASATAIEVRNERMVTSFRMDIFARSCTASAAALAFALAVAAGAKEPDLAEAAQAIVAGTNELRLSRGLDRVEVTPLLAETARDFAVFMART